MKKFILIIIFVIVALTISCSECSEIFVKEYNNQFGHYFSFEKVTLYQDEQGTTLDFNAIKNFEGATDIKLVFNSESQNIHLARFHDIDPTLFIKVGEQTEAIDKKVYSFEHKDKYKEVASYIISKENLRKLLKARKSFGMEFDLNDYKITVSDQVACALRQLIH
jgi:hypothetical protein